MNTFVGVSYTSFIGLQHSEEGRFAGSVIFFEAFSSAPRSSGSLCHIRTRCGVRADSVFSMLSSLFSLVAAILRMTLRHVLFGSRSLEVDRRVSCHGLVSLASPLVFRSFRPEVSRTTGYVSSLPFSFTALVLLDLQIILNRVSCWPSYDTPLTTLSCMTELFDPWCLRGCLGPAR